MDRLPEAAASRALLIESYEQAIDFLFGRINYERMQVEAYSTSDFKLDRMRRLLEFMGNPHLQLPAIHVAGTKGKGSTCSMLASILQASGFRCGLYISPHITAFEERFTVNGAMPAREQLVDLLNQLMPIISRMDNLPGRMQPTYFELATALAWLHFLDQRVDVVVLEVGLGGRLDSTNLCRPLVTCITNVSRDHTHVLGSTVRQIAHEKAGIIKSGVPVVSGATHPDAAEMIEEIALQRKAPLRIIDRDFELIDRSIDSHGNVEITARSGTTVYRRVPVILRGQHQAVNATIALAVVDELRKVGWDLSDQAVETGLRNVVWPARVEVVKQSPVVILDAAHNWESARALAASLEEFTPRKRVLIFAATKDKDVAGILRQLLPNFHSLILTRYVENQRSVPLDELTSLVESMTSRPFHTASDPKSAWSLATQIASANDLIVITGSFFLVAELRSTIVG